MRFTVREVFANVKLPPRLTCFVIQFLLFFVDNGFRSGLEIAGLVDIRQ